MPKAKPSDSGKTQSEKFIEAAREHGADADDDTFRRAVREIATAPVAKPKKGASKTKK